MKHETDCLGIVTVKAPASWLLAHIDALGAAWIRPKLGNELRLIGGIDALRDGSKVILEYGSTGELVVDPDFQIEVSKTTYETLN